MTADLVAFLRARLAEDELVAQACGRHDAFDGTGIVPGATARGPVMAVLPSHVATHIARHDPARVLAEVDAKRRVIAEIVPNVHDLEATVENDRGLSTDPPHVWADEMLLRMLALPYREHPDYQPEWAPET